MSYTMKSLILSAIFRSLSLCRLNRSKVLSNTFSNSFRKRDMLNLFSRKFPIALALRWVIVSLLYHDLYRSARIFFSFFPFFFLLSFFFKKKKEKSRGILKFICPLSQEWRNESFWLFYYPEVWSVGILRLISVSLPLRVYLCFFTIDSKTHVNLAFCLNQLPVSERSVKKLVENFKFYKGALYDKKCAEEFESLLMKCRKISKLDEKPILREFESLIMGTLEQNGLRSQVDSDPPSVKSVKDRLNDTSEDDISVRLEHLDVTDDDVSSWILFPCIPSLRGKKNEVFSCFLLLCIVFWCQHARCWGVGIQQSE